MSFKETGIGGGAGKVYDVNEGGRLLDFGSKFNQLADQADKVDNKRRDIVRYVVIGGGAILILVGLRFLVKRRK